MNKSAGISLLNRLIAFNLGLVHSPLVTEPLRGGSRVHIMITGRNQRGRAMSVAIIVFHFNAFPVVTFKFYGIVIRNMSVVCGEIRIITKQ